MYTVAFSPDGTRLASGSDDRQLWRWDLATGKGARRGDHKAGGIRVVTYPSDDQIISTGWDREVRIWNGDDPTPELWPEAGAVHGAALAPDGGTLVTGGDMTAIHACTSRGSRHTPTSGSTTRSMSCGTGEIRASLRS